MCGAYLYGTAQVLSLLLISLALISKAILFALKKREEIKTKKNIENLIKDLANKTLETNNLDLNTVKMHGSYEN